MIILIRKFSNVVMRTLIFPDVTDVCLTTELEKLINKNEKEQRKLKALYTGMWMVTFQCVSPFCYPHLILNTLCVGKAVCCSNL